MRCPKCLPHLAHSQRCRDSAGGTADHADSDTSANQRMIKASSLSAAMPDDRFRPFAEVRLTVLGDGIETTRTLGYVSFKPTRLPKTLGRASFGGLNEGEPHVPAFRTDRSSSGHPSKRIFEAQHSKRTAGLVAGLALASSETFAAGPMIAPGALATTSVGSAEASVEKTVVVVRRRAVVRRPVVRRHVVVRRRFVR